MESNQTILQIVELAKHINKLHADFSSQWLSQTAAPYNLKSKQINDVFSDDAELKPEFIQYMDDYCDLLLDELLLNAHYNTLLENYPIRTRIKEPNSRMPKLYHYKLNKGEGGRVNLKKCLNDLFGFRIFVENFDHSDATEKHLTDLLHDLKGIKVHNSSKGDYQATHIYFQNGNNKFFPWELQIWCNKDEHTNIESHAKHKQAYTKWPRIYIENHES